MLAGVWEVLEKGELLFMPSFKDRTGEKYGSLTVVERVKNRNGRVCWLCKCDCGNMIVVSTRNINKQKSCGCKNQRCKTHGQTDTRLYTIWSRMKQRCYDKNYTEYDNYGGRGIFVCNEWKNSFENFYLWAIENGYSDALTIDRIDNNQGYAPNNCRFVNRTVQANNTRQNHRITYKDVTLTLAEWCKILNLPYHTIKKRLNTSGWSVSEAFEIPIRGNRCGK